MKNENLPSGDPTLVDQTLLDQAQHERLCAYVFGELAGAERAAFEAELLRSPALRREQEQLEATVGLVKRAVPDEGLSADVRRELLASARRSRFRFVPGRRMLQLAAACVVILGGALALRRWNEVRTHGPEIRDGAQVARARLDESAKMAKRRAEVAPEELEAKDSAVVSDSAFNAGDDSPLASVPAAQELPAAAPQLEALGADFESDGLDALGYGESAQEEPSAGLQDALQPRIEAEVAALTIQPTTTLLSFDGKATQTGADGFFLGAKTSAPASPGASGPSSPGLTTGISGAAPGRFGQRSGERASLASQKGAPVPPAEAAPELLQALGYSGLAAGSSASTGSQEVMGKPSFEMSQRRKLHEPDKDDMAEVERYFAALNRPFSGDSKEVQELLKRAAESRVPTLDGPLDAPGIDLSAQARAQLAQHEVDQILGACRVGAGESPDAMFFRYFGDAPFVAALEERTSTFAADVDTASYALARAYLDLGQLPPREAVRTEEFVNYFKADQPAPTDGKPFALGLELAPSLFGGDARTEMLRISVRGKDVADFERQPLALTFVIDNSGSMADGGRLELVKRALALLLRQLYASDSVAIVKFSNSAAVVTPMIQATRRGELEGLIQGLPIEGGTNVEAGLRLGYEQALANLQPRAVNRVILCSDGVGNIGETSAKGLLALVEEARKRGLYLNTVGVGMGNHDDAFLEELADEGDGVCNYVDSDAEAKRVFVDGLASLVQPIARDVKIQVEFDPTQVERWRLLGYENRALRTQDFRDDAIDAGEVNAGHQVSALYELVRRPGAGGPLATVRLRYKPPFAIDAGQEGSAARAAAEQALELERSIAASDALPGFAAATNGYQRAVLAAQFAEVLRRSIHARPDSFATLLSEARRLERSLRDADFTELVALLERANPLLDAHTREDTPRVRELLDELGRLHYETALRARQRELAAQAGEPAPLAEEQRESEAREGAVRGQIQRLEAELRAALFRARGLEPQPSPQELEGLRALGYADDKK